MNRLFPFLLILLMCFALYAQENNEKDNDIGKSIHAPEHKKQLSKNELQRLDYYRKEALNALKKGEYQYSAVMFENYLKIRDDNPKIYEYVTPVYLKLNRQEDALNVLNKLIELRPNSFIAYFELGKLYRDMGEYETAIDNFNKSLDINKNIEAYFQLALTYERMNKLDKSEKIYKEIIILDPKHAEANFSLGLLYLRKKDYKNAENKISRAIEINPNNLNYSMYLQKVQSLLHEKPNTPSIPEPENN